MWRTVDRAAQMGCESVARTRHPTHTKGRERLTQEGAPGTGQLRAPGDYGATLTPALARVSG